MYQILDNPVPCEEASHALGHGIAVIHRNSIQVTRLLSQANTDRLLICRVSTSASYSFILVAYHADPHHLKEALALFEHSLRMIKVRYGEGDIIIKGQSLPNHLVMHSGLLP